MTGDRYRPLTASSGRQLRTGDHIRVVVTAVNPIEGLVDLSLAEEA